MTIEIGALADLYYQNFAQMPEHLKKRLSMEMLREIFDKMVNPSLKSWNNPPEEELSKEDDATKARRYAKELSKEIEHANILFDALSDLIDLHEDEPQRPAVAYALDVWNDHKLRRKELP